LPITDRGERAAEELALRGDDVDVGRRPEVDDHAGRAEQPVRGEGVHDSVGAHLARVVHQQRHAGAHAGPDHDARQPRPAVEQQPQLAQQARHGGQRRDRADLGRERAQQAADRDLQLVGGHVPVGAHPPVPDQRRARQVRAGIGRGVDPERDLGVADVDAEEHGVIRPRARTRR
jgi:hypothetical protein